MICIRRYYLNIILLLFFSAGCGSGDGSDIFRGQYFGQKPPGIKPELLAPGLISSSDFEYCSGFLQNGKAFIFKRQEYTGEDFSESDFYNSPTLFTELRDDNWTEPTVVPFNDLHPFNFTTAPDSRSFLFTSKCSEEISDNSLKSAIWKVELANDGWGKPQRLGSPINSGTGDSYASMTADGTLYFMSGREGGFGRSDIYRSELVNGEYIISENLRRPVNSEERELDPVISPDESYLIFCADLPGGFGSFDLYITFRNSDGTWTEPVNMGREVNTLHAENRANITPDGKYILFMRGTTEYSDIYWMESKVINKIKNEKRK